jgi:hypothetical protein
VTRFITRNPYLAQTRSRHIDTEFLDHLEMPLIRLPAPSPRIAGRRPPAAMTALDLQRWRLAKPVATSVFSPRCGEKVPAGG